MDLNKLFPLMSFNEADDDDDNTATNEDPGADTGDTTDGGDADNADTGDDEDAGNDEFDIDTSIDDEGDDEEGGGDDTAADDDTGGGDTDGGDTSSMADAEQEANPINTEIFDSLTPEEQAVKIKELKRLYKDLYTSVVDLSTRVRDTKIDEDNIDMMDRINSDLYDLKTYIRDYFTNSFETKSYIENDIKFSQFLFYLNSIKDVIEKVASSNEKKHGENDVTRDKK